MSFIDQSLDFNYLLDVMRQYTHHSTHIELPSNKPFDPSSYFDLYALYHLEQLSRATCAKTIENEENVAGFMLPGELLVCRVGVPSD